MGKKKGCKDCPDTGRDMSRGEFLKTGAVAAGGVAVGGGGLDVDAAPAGIENGSSVSQCPPTRHEWAIPAGLLNIFWADIYPRLVALHWSNPGAGILVPDMPIGALSASINLIPRAPGSEFERRVKMFLRYLSWPHAIPINVRGEGAYDFVLTSGVPSTSGMSPPPPPDDGGLVLFIPGKPSAVELLRYFTFRNTGRPALGVPDYLDGPYSGVTIDAPTGPNSLTLSNVATQQIIAFGCDSGPQDEETRRGLAKDIFAYKCKNSRRCWQIEGAVYRGVVTEVARIVAVIWFEELNRIELLNSLQNTPEGQTALNCATNAGVNLQTLWPQSGKRYREMFVLPGNFGLRRIFEERLELTLPQVGEMAFEIHPGTQSDPAFVNFIFTDSVDENGNPKEPVSSFERDVIITRKGFYFPVLPPMNKDINQLCSDLANGLAGNPVFTSSERTLLF